MEFFVFLLIVWGISRWLKRRRARRAVTQYQPSNPVYPTYSAPVQSYQTHNSTPSSGEGWFPDPTNRYVGRYWNGQHWTEWVMAANQQVSSDPIVVNINLPGARRASTPAPQPQYQAPNPSSQVDGPDLNELRRRFNN
jgi:hypothetical protein